MDDKELAEAARNRRLLWICAFALIWELFVRPLLGILFPGIELPPSLLREILNLAGALNGLPV